MISLELKKIKRNKILLIVFIVIASGALIQYMMGKMTYMGSAYGDELGWFFRNGLVMNSYYFFIPVITLFGMEQITLETRYNTLKNLLVIPYSKRKILLDKFRLLFIFTIIYLIITFLSMLLLEAIFNNDELSVGIILSYFLKYFIHGMIGFLISTFVIVTMLFSKQSLHVTVAVAFVISFLGVFVSQLSYAYLYFINAMFYISGAVSSGLFERLIAIVVVSFIAVIGYLLFLKITSDDEGYDFLT